MCLQVFFEIFLFDFIPFVIFERIRIALFIYSKITLNVKNIFVFFFFLMYTFDPYIYNMNLYTFQKKCYISYVLNSYLNYEYSCTRKVYSMNCTKYSK